LFRHRLSSFMLFASSTLVSIPLRELFLFRPSRNQARY